MQSPQNLTRQQRWESLLFCSTSELRGYSIYLATSIPVRSFNPKLAVSKEEPSSAHLNYSQSMSFWPSTTLPARLGAEGAAFAAVGTQTARAELSAFPPTASPPLELSSHFLATYPSPFACPFSYKVSVLSYQTLPNT